jgi:two-component sensor histidine kinase
MTSLAVHAEKIDDGYEGGGGDDIIREYNTMIEELRTRLNVLSTSLFLLHESTNTDDPKAKRYLNSVNQEMERIRNIISKYPKNTK